MTSECQTLQTCGGKPGQGYQCVLCFAQNTRDEVRIVRGGVCGAIAAEPGMKQQNYIAHTEGQ